MGTPPGWNAQKMYELGTRHAELEARGKLDELMATLVTDPVYEFHPSGLKMRGGDLVQRYYAQFIENFIPMTAGYTLVEEWVNESSVSQEYEIVLRVDGALEKHRVIGVLYAEGEQLGGERIYSSELFVRRMAGEIFDELEPIESTTPTRGPA